MSSSSKRGLNEDILSKRIRKSTVDQNDREITRFETLSNEILYEIFDYLDGSDIFYGFLSINLRFNRLIMYSSLPIKLSCSASFDDMTNTHYQQLIITNRHRIISLYLKDQLHLSYFSSLLTNYELFNRLESIVLENIPYNSLISLLPNLRILPRLFSLKIDVKNIEPESSNLYRLIFSLPMLRYHKLTTCRNYFPFILQANIDQISSIEHLVIDYLCEILELFNILSHTPQLNHLTCKKLTRFRLEPIQLPVNILHLRSISIEECSLTFDTFEILTKNFFSQIEILHLVTSYVSSYIDPDRWEQLILKSMPRLKILNFKYSVLTFDQDYLQQYHSILNRFISSFWIERKWFFEFQLRPNRIPSIKINCSIQPLKKQWYEFCLIFNQKKCINIPILRLHLIIGESQLSVHYANFEQYVCSFAVLTQFTNLHIDFYQFSIRIILQYLHHLPNLDSLTITSKFPETMKIVSKEQTNMFDLVSNQNKITKLSLEQMTELDQVHLLMDLCPHLHYLQLTCRNISDAEWLIRYVLTKQNTNFIPYLCLICISLSNADDIITNNLQNIIDSEKLVENYKILRICDRIYLQWNDR